MSNRLAKESSPYLLQHAENPVDWWPWCEQAFEDARKKDKPVFLSVGYSACHWCHVMEHESFEDEKIAKFLNKHFVSIKVDREERPDVDHIYMQAVMALSGHGGWPLSAFLTPDQKFFFGGTYWPPHSSRGMPGFDQVLQSVATAYTEKRDTIEQQSDQVSSLLKQNSLAANMDSNIGAELISRQTIAKAVDALQKSFDVNDGGFGSAPKFPHPMDLNLLIQTLDYADQLNGQSRASVLQIIEVTLNKMANGGIYDHLGGGFARYSVDSKWLVPHFEKMLYDNAQLARVYTNAFRATNHAFYQRVAEDTLEYVLTYLLDEQGGFHSTEDADSEGVEGKFYVWSKREILDVLGEEIGRRFCSFFDVTDAGNFEGANILNVNQTLEEFTEKHDLDKSQFQTELREAREKLLVVRDQRIRPAKDDKILVSWNALAIDAFANAAVVFNSNKYLDAAKQAANFVLNSLRREDGRLLHTWRHGQAKLDAYLDDYSYLINALVTLYEAEFDEQWIEHAVELAQLMIQRFGDVEGGFFFTADDHESLIVRTRDLQDSSVPSGNSMASLALLRLGRICANSHWIETAEKTIQTAGTLIERAPMATGQMLLAIDLRVRPNRQLVLIGGHDKTVANHLAKIIQANKDSGSMLIVRNLDDSQYTSEHLDKVFAGKESKDHQPTLYDCENFTCQAPVVGGESILKNLDIEIPKQTDYPAKPENIGEVV